MSDVAGLIELKPCPFCGDNRAMVFEPTCRPETPYNPADRLFPIVRCMSCYAEAAGKSEDYRGVTAIAAWNNRPPEASLSARIAELERERDAMVESRNFTLSDHQRLLRRSDVEGICDSIGSCFEDPDGVARCGPCAIKAAEAVGVVVRYSIPHAPQEARLGRELRAAEAKLAKAEEALTTAQVELLEAADKFNVIHHNHPGAAADRGIGRYQAEDKEFCAKWSGRASDAAARARAVLAALSPMLNKEG